MFIDGGRRSARQGAVGVKVNGGAQAVAPGAPAGGRKHQTVGRAANAVQRDIRRLRVLVQYPHHQRQRAAVEVEVAHRIAQGAGCVQTAKAPFKIGKAGQQHGLVGGPGGRAAHKGRDRCGHACNRANAAGEFLDVDAGIAECCWHGVSPFSLNQYQAPADRPEQAGAAGDGRDVSGVEAVACQPCKAGFVGCAGVGLPAWWRAPGKARASAAESRCEALAPVP